MYFLLLSGLHFGVSKTANVRKKATLRRYDVTIFAVRESATLRYPAYNAHALYYIGASGPSGSTIFFPRCPINGTIFRRMLLNTKRVFM